MGNCSGYCNGQQENEDGQIRSAAFNKQEMLSNNVNRKDFEEKYGQGGLAAFDNEGFEDDNDQVDENGRVTKGPLTLKNGATYNGQWR